MSDNMRVYEMGREVPEEAKRTISAGKLKGFTDINPMWRIKVLTEMFGPCGQGWYTEIVRDWNEEGKDGRIAKFCEIKLYVKFDSEWSKPIVGVGGSMFVNKEKDYLISSDEALKMAYTDAISVACKALGIGADVYFAKDRTKYDQPEPAEPVKCCQCGQKLKATIKTTNGDYTAEEYAKATNGLCPECYVKAMAAAKNAGGSK
ncbi:hypothetical protein [Anaerotignum sp.]